MNYSVMNKIMSLLACICKVSVFVKSLVEGPGISFVGGIICPQASQTCCDNQKPNAVIRIALVVFPISCLTNMVTPFRKTSFNNTKTRFLRRIFSTFSETSPDGKRKIVQHDIQFVNLLVINIK